DPGEELVMRVSAGRDTHSIAPGRSAVARSRRLHLHEHAGPVVVGDVERAEAVGGAVVDSDNWDVSDPLGRVGQTTIERAATIRSEIGPAVPSSPVPATGHQ